MTSYRELAKPHFEQVFKLMDECFVDCGITYYLIGAQARDIHLLESNIKPARMTLDIDFAVMIPDFDVYDNLLEMLVNKGFKKIGVPYRIVHIESDTIIDLLPFGEIEQAGTVRFDKREIELSVIGLKEISEKAIPYQLDTVTIQVSPLEGLFILKLISNSEKPERTKDLDDLSQIIENYFWMDPDRVYDDNWLQIKDIEEANYTLLAGARLLGIDVGKILNSSKELNSLISSIIDKEIQEEPGSISLYFLHKEKFRDHDLVKKIFRHIKDGIDFTGTEY